jgi:DNA adenine methylase
MSVVAPSFLPLTEYLAEFPEKRALTYNGRHSQVPSLLKWTGSKRSQAGRIAHIIAQHSRYFEPFLGGGALLFHFAKPDARASDIYAPLIQFWELVRDEPEHLAADYASQWQCLQSDLPAYFYVVRKRFNEEQRPEDLNFLMRTCVNGIVRFSKRGQFNNSFHLSRRGMLPKSFYNIVLKWSQRLCGVRFRQCDYAESLEEARSGDFVYLDPPYLGNKQRYIGDLDVDRFYLELEQLNRRDVKWALSFDGKRGERVYKTAVPPDIYKTVISLESGYSPVAKVLNGPIEQVTETLYLNY